MNLFFRRGLLVLRHGFIPGPECRAKCCENGGGPGPGGEPCDDPDNCYYELTRCRGSGDPTRLFISVRIYDYNVRRLGGTSGMCMWGTHARAPRGFCHYIEYPTRQQAIPRTQIEPLISAGLGVLVGTLYLLPDHSCCDCADGCLRADLFPDESNNNPTKCCCNCLGACVRTNWGYFFRQRTTALDDPNYWIDDSTKGSGIDVQCNGPPNQVPTVTHTITVGPSVPSQPAPPTTVPFDTNNFPSFGCGGPHGGCIGECVGYFFNAICRAGPLPNQTDPPPAPVAGCRTLRWSWVAHEEHTDCDSSIPPRCFRVVTDFVGWSNSTLDQGQADCGGGCFDTTPIEAVADANRPLAIKVISALRSSTDAGVGDTIERIVGYVGGDLFKRWFRGATGRDCGCSGRAAILNAKYPYPEPTA